MKTVIRSEQIGDAEVKRADLNVTTSSSAVIAKAVQGTGISLSSTGVDAGTGDVTINIDSTVATLTGTQTLTNKTISGSSNTLSNIGNSSLTNSSLTIGSTSVSLGGTAATLAGLTTVTVTQDPTSALQLATKQYVDSVANGFSVKQSVKVATTANVTLSGGAPDTVDGVSLSANDRILVKNQTAGAENGLFKVDTVGTGANGTWTRTTDADASAEVVNGLFVWVNQGTTNGDTGWVLTTDGTITLDTTTLTFTQFTGVGQIVAGSGLTKTAPNTLNIGAGTGITVNADDVQISTSYTGQASINTVGTVITGTWQASILASNYGGTGQNFAGSSGLVKFVSGTASVVTAPSGTVVGTSDTQTLTNKTLDNTNTVTLSDSLFTLQDNSDNTKQLQLQLSGIATATTRTLTIPDANTTIVGIDTTQTLSNKTIAGTGLSFTGSTSGSINVLATATAGSNTLTLPAVTGNFVTTGDTGTVTNTMLAGSIANAKLTNSTISGIALGSNLAALTIGTGLSGTSYNGSAAVTIAIDSTVATLTGSQTLTNKTLTSPVLNGTVSGTAVSTAATANLLLLRDGNANGLANNLIQGYTTTATAAGTTTLTVASAYLQYFTGSTTQTVAMPDVTTLALGMQWLIVNNSSGAVTVQSSGANSIQVMAASSRLLITCIALTGTGTAAWSATYSPILTNVENTALSTWAGSTNLTTLGTVGTGTWNATTIAVNKGGTGLTAGTDGGILAFTATGTIASSAALTNNSIVLGGGAGATPKVVAGITTDGTAKLNLGVAGTSVGSIGLSNATSGSITIEPTTGALGTITLTLPAFTGTAVVAATSTTATQALFATTTAGAPNYRAIAATDLPAALSSSTSINGLAITASTGTLTVANSKTATINNTITFAGTDSTTMTFPAATGTVVTTDSTATLTNKTFDAEGTGNSLTIPVKVWFPAAGINNTSVGSMWDLPTANAAVPTANTGTNVQKATLDFNSTAVAQQTLFLPADFTGNIDVNIIWFTSATTGNCKWLISTSFSATNQTETDDFAWNTASTVTTAAAGTASRISTSSISNVTSSGTTSSGASKLMHIKIARDGSEASPITTARLVGLELTFRRAI